MTRHGGLRLELHSQLQPKWQHVRHPFQATKRLAATLNNTHTVQHGHHNFVGCILEEYPTAW